MSQRFCLEVKGDFACFTRPEMKAERMSYDVMTPSAARAIFESILWKPAIQWQIEVIQVLSPIRWVSLRRNEVDDKILLRNVTTAMKTGKGQLGLYVDEGHRVQRASLFLRDVKYRITASFVMTSRAGPDDNVFKHSEMFRRRASKGQCINQPYLGCREFSCDFKLLELDEAVSVPDEVMGTRDLGWMLYDMDFSNLNDPKPRFFKPIMENSKIVVPHHQSDEVRG